MTRFIRNSKPKLPKKNPMLSTSIWISRTKRQTAFAHCLTASFSFATIRRTKPKLLNWQTWAKLNSFSFGAVSRSKRATKTAITSFAVPKCECHRCSAPPQENWRVRERAKKYPTRRLIAVPSAESRMLREEQVAKNVSTRKNFSHVLSLMRNRI